MSALQFIDITRRRTPDKLPDRCSLLIQGDELQVIGELPHTYFIRPVNRKHRDRLVAFLNSLEYENETDF